MRRYVLPLSDRSPNLCRAFRHAHAGRRPRRAEARDRGAQAPSLSRPADSPPAHVVARAAHECGKERNETEMAKEQGRTVIGAEGCKIKGGLARARQVLKRLDVFIVSVISQSTSGLANRMQALRSIGDLSYPATWIAKIVEEFP